MNEKRRTAPRTGSQRFQNLPLLLLMSYLLTVFAVFLIWPINWPIYNQSAWALLTAYVLTCFTALTVMFIVGVRGAAPAGQFRHVRSTIAIGAIATVTLLTPLSILYTGRGPWDVLAALAEQSDTYLLGQEQLYVRDTSGRVASALSALAGPFTFAVLPLGVLYWGRLSIAFKLAVLATVLSSITLSVMRGTDREIANIIIVGGSAFLISIGRGSRFGSPVIKLIRRYWKPALLMAIVFYIAAGVFTERKSDRLGSVQRACVGGLHICADLDAPLISWMDDRSKFGLSFFVLSVSQGFYGLELGLEKEFLPTWGVGHSPAILSIYANMSGDDAIIGRTYTDRNRLEGWSDQNYWSTMLLWFANDIGFVGVVFLLLALGFLWGRAWRDATYGQNDAAAVLFCVIMLMLFYLPANNQVFNTLDGYTTFFGWLVIWRTGVGRMMVTRSTR